MVHHCYVGNENLGYYWKTKYINGKLTGNIVFEIRFLTAQLAKLL